MIWLTGPLVLGLGGTQMVLLALTVVVGTLTVVPGRANVLQGGIHLGLFAAFLFLAANPVTPRARFAVGRGLLRGPDAYCRGMSEGTVADLVGRLNGWLRRLMPEGPRRDRLTGALAAAADGRPVTAAACRRVEQVAWQHSRHLELQFDPAGRNRPDEEPRGWPAADPAGTRIRAAGVSAVRRLDDGTGLIVVDALESWAVARPYVDAAFALARGSARVVLDLRANGGGDPATVAAIAGWLLGDAAQELSEVVYRDRRRQWWTADRPPGTALTQDVSVLVAGADLLVRRGAGLPPAGARPGDRGRRGHPGRGRPRHAGPAHPARARVAAGGVRPGRPHRRQLGRHRGPAGPAV